jgi:starvation-inducible DNA-binding protein
MLEVEEKKENKRKIFSTLGYSEDEANELTASLNSLLASYHVHYQKLRNFHWNVKGPDFFDVHEKFEEQYNGAQLAIDDIAERIRVFGRRPYSTMKELLENSKIEETEDEDIEAMEMVKEIIRDYRILMEQIFDVIELSIEYGDSGTEDMMKDLIKSLEKNHWMMSAFSSES